MLMVGIVAVLAFFMQSSSCFAERAGLFSCHGHVADHSCPDSHEGESADCCHVVSTALLAQPISTAPLLLKEFSYFAPVVGAPEGPVEEIDYPPQRLS
jgi:hypothetical protein